MHVAFTPSLVRFTVYLPPAYSQLAVTVQLFIECVLLLLLYCCCVRLQIYSQLAKVLGKVFFPTGNAAVQAVSFWGLFAGAQRTQAATG
jgi:hypothetical protein